MIPAPARPVKRRPYTHLACQMCKEKHIKCDGVKPECTYCRAKRVPCVYREERNRKRDASVDGGDDTVRQLGLRLAAQATKWRTKYKALKARVDPSGQMHRIADLSSGEEEEDLSILIKEEPSDSVHSSETGSAGPVFAHRMRDGGRSWTWAGGTAEEFYQSQGISAPNPNAPKSPMSGHEYSQDMEFASSASLLETPFEEASARYQAAQQMRHSTPQSPPMIHIPRHQPAAATVPKPKDPHGTVAVKMSSGRTILRHTGPKSPAVDEQSRQRRSRSFDEREGQRMDIAEQTGVPQMAPFAPQQPVFGHPQMGQHHGHGHDQVRSDFFDPHHGHHAMPPQPLGFMPLQQPLAPQMQFAPMADMHTQDFQGDDQMMVDQTPTHW